ncbi:MAG TPA: DUF5658 family protein [Fimbriimonadaceae bacterium]|nr:DUF5658 family protein [Fimbriimonadaceae bacterium]
MKNQTTDRNVWAAIVPTRALAVLMVIGFLDLFTTALLHAHGQIVELNPVMRPFINRSEWLFVGVKSFSLLAAWAVLAWYAQQNLRFVRKACYIGSITYVMVWCIWFLAAS